MNGAENVAGDAVGTAADTAGKVAESLGLLDIIEQGGIILVIIMALFLVGIVIIIERLLSLNGIKKDEQLSMNKVSTSLKVGKIQEALTFCKKNDSPACNIMKAGILNRDRSETDIKEAILSAASLEIPKLEKFISALGTIAHIAPLLGLLGTVTGNIETFGVLGGGTTNNSTELAKGIAEALLTTAGGIIVAISTLIFYNYFVSRINNIILRMENKVNDIVGMLKGRRPRPIRPGAQ